MSFVLQPWQLLFAILAGWIHHRQQNIELQNDQIQVLLKQVGKKRLVLTDDQRRILAVKGKALARKTIQQSTTILTPDTILRFAQENPTWGYDRIQGALANAGYQISDTTMGNILKQNGIEPAPDRQRQTTWATFLKTQWDVLAAIDFTTIEVWTKGGLVTYYLLFVMELKTRRVHFAGCTANLNEHWMTNETDQFGCTCGRPTQLQTLS